jgi:hypothetical protein
MKVTVCPGRYAIYRAREKRRGLITGVEKLTIDSIASAKLNPLNPVVIGHGVIDGTDGYLTATLNRFQYGYMFFYCSVGGVLGLQYHLLTAAHQFSTTSGKYLCNVATNITLIHTKFLRHWFSSYG